MHSHLSVENPPALPHRAVVEALERALRDRSAEGEAAGVLVGTALKDDDARFVEHWCVPVGTRAVSGSPLLGLAGLRLGHTARRFGHLSDEARALATRGGELGSMRLSDELLGLLDLGVELLILAQVVGGE